MERVPFGFRFAILLLTFFCLSSIAANYSIINFAFICMTEDKSDVITSPDGEFQHRYEYSPAEKSYLMWAVSAGTIIGTVPLNLASVHFGAKVPFFLAGVLSSAAALATPLAAHAGFLFFLIIRFVQGLSFAADFAAVGVVTVRWAPLSETAIFLGFFTAFSAFSNAISNGVTGAFCMSSLGWRWSFYSHGMVGLVLFSFWLLLYSDDPQSHSLVSAKELETIQKDKTREHIERDSFVPFKQILRSRTILVVWFNAFTELVSVVSLLTYAPLYINKVLHYDKESTAVITFISSFLVFPLKLSVAFLSDWVTCFPEIPKMIFFNTVALGLGGVATGLIPFSPTPFVAVLCFVLQNCLASANSSGFYKCGTLHSRQFAHVVLATIQFMKCFALFVGPALTAIFLDSDEDAEGWKIVFLINAGAMIVTESLMGRVPFGFRFAILLLTFFCLSSIAANYSIINFAFICMTEDKSDVITSPNGEFQHRYEYSPAEKSYLMWAVSAGTIIGTIPLNLASVHFGAKFPFLLAGTLSSLATLATPAAAHAGFLFFLLLRFLQGLAFAADFAAVGVVTVRWAPLAETATFLGFFTAFSPMANAISNGVTGAFCTSSLGWRWSFYSHGMVGLVLFSFWLLLYSDDPQSHSLVSAKELETIQKDKTREHIERDSFVPFKQILRSRTILVVWFNAFTELVSVISLLTYAPLYVNKVLKFDKESTAVITFVSSFLHFPIKLVFAFLSDWVTRFSEISKMVFFNTLALGLGGIVTGFIPFSPTPFVAVLCFVLQNCLASANSSGFYKCGTLHSRQFAHVVLATIQFMKCFALFVGPALTAIFLDSDEDAEGWKIVFLINAGAMIVVRR